jgi:hypothetical protein
MSTRQHSLVQAKRELKAAAVAVLKQIAGCGLPLPTASAS